MDPRNHALLIGIDSFEEPFLEAEVGREEHCMRLQSLLAHPCLGNFAPENIELVPSDEADSDTCLAALYRTLIRGKSSRDSVFIYLATPLFTHRSNFKTFPFLATKDTDFLGLLDNPYRGLRLDFLLSDLFAESRAGQVFLVLDTPFVGVLKSQEPFLHLPLLSEQSQTPVRTLISELGIQKREGLTAYVLDARCGSDLARGFFDRFLSTLRPEDEGAESGRVDVARVVQELPNKAGDLRSANIIGDPQSPYVLTWPVPRALRIQLEIDMPSMQSGIYTKAELRNPLGLVCSYVRELCERLGDKTPRVGAQRSGALERDALIIVGRSLEKLYKKGMARNPLAVEGSILDDLQERFGYLPEEAAIRRLELFQERLHQVEAWFQPIVHLARSEIRISGWETLARDQGTERIPEDLFRAAELWGTPFQILLDTHMCSRALARFTEDTAELRRDGGAVEDQDLSVNVYPGTLLSTAYYETLEELLQGDKISPERFHLEISEKLAIPRLFGEKSVAAVHATLRQHLRRMSQDLGVSFSIDDFGVGYSTIERLRSLDAMQVKIDRSVLFSPEPKRLITYIRDLVALSSKSDPRLVLEGIDTECPLGLDEILELGVEYIQGFVISAAGPKLWALDEDLVGFIEEKIAARDREQTVLYSAS